MKYAIDYMLGGRKQTIIVEADDRDDAYDRARGELRRQFPSAAIQGGARPASQDDLDRSGQFSGPSGGAMQTMHDFVKKYGITATAEQVDHNPNMADDQWANEATHWKVTLRYGKRSMSIIFSQGSAIHEEPTAEAVLNSVALDVSGLQNAGSFEEWCAEYGYEIPEEVRGLTKRQAENYGYDREWAEAEKIRKTYKAIEKEEEKLTKFLDDGEVVHELLYETESL